MDVVEVVLLLKNVSQFVSGAADASGAIKKVGTEAEDTGKKAQVGWKGLAKWAATGATVYGATRFIQSATSATTDLAKSTMTLTRTTGMDAETSSEWAALTKERGISSKSLQTSLVKLSRTMDTARQGTAKENTTVQSLREQIDAVSAAGGKTAPAQIAKLSRALASAQTQGDKSRATLERLGVPLETIQHGTTADVLYKVSDALRGMHDPAARAALVQQVFGKQGQALLPILMQGSEGVRKLLDEQKKSGNYLSGQGLQSAQKMIEQQRELTREYDGLKVQLGQALIPILIQLGKVVSAVATFLLPLTRHTKLMTALIIALTVAFVAWKVVLIASTIAQLELNAAMLANPVGLIILGVAALIILVVVLYKKWKWFHDAVNATWQWVKANWPLLLIMLVSPIAGAVLLIIKYWAQIRGGALAVWQWVKNNWPLLVGALAGPFGIAAALIITHFQSVKNVALEVIDTIKHAIQGVLDMVTSIPDKVGGALKSIPGAGVVSKGVGAVASVVPHQYGGVLPARGGVALVGEHGPELLALPGAARITPLPQPQFAGAGAAGSGDLVIHVPVVVDGREIARATARVAANRLARR